jgi:hypothetical protein
MRGPQLTRLLSYVKNRIELEQSEGRDVFTVSDIGSLKRALCGRGVLYSWAQPGEEAALRCQFSLSNSILANVEGNDLEGVRVPFEARWRFPCSGIITRTLEGFIVAPAIQLEPVKGSSVVLMTISPTRAPHGLSVDKNILAIPNEESTVAVTTGGGQVNCSGTVPVHAKAAKIVLNRNPGHPVYPSGFNETLSEIKGNGQISGVWKPVARSFEELVVAFSPWDMNSFGSRSFGFPEIARFSFDRIASNLNAFEDEYPPRPGDYVIGEGNGVIYTIRLILDRGLGRHASDETGITVT